MKKFLTFFLSDNSGMSAVEYGLLLATIGLAALIGMRFLGNNMSEFFSSVSQAWQ